MMSAKHRLNATRFCGALLVAGLVGWLTGSVLPFLIALSALLVAGSHAGDIRRRLPCRPFACSCAGLYQADARAGGWMTESTKETVGLPFLAIPSKAAGDSLRQDPQWAGSTGLGGAKDLR